MSAQAAKGGEAALPFPSLAWFERLIAQMRANQERFEKLGYVDTVAVFTVIDGGKGGKPFSVQITFEEFDVIDIKEIPGGSLPDAADFALEATIAQWKDMFDSIKENGGKPALEKTLNRLTMLGDEILVRTDDQLKKDMFFRYGQSFQELMNCTAAFETAYAGGRA